VGEQTKTLETIVEVIPVYGSVIKTAIQIFDFAHNFGRSTPLDQTLADFQKQIDALVAGLEEVNRRLNVHAQRIVKIENERHVDKLLTLGRELQRIAFRILQSPADAGERSLLAFDAVALANRFLDEPDIWEWTDIGITRDFDDDGNFLRSHVEILDPDFKSHLALPLYSNAVLLLLVAIDMDTKGDPSTVERRYRQRLERHIAAVLSRDGWDDLNDPPLTLAEMIRARITCRPFALNKFAAKGECVFGIVCENVMERRSTNIRDVSILLADEGPSVLCTVNADIGRSDEEDIEGEKGVLLLTELGDMMRRVRDTGSLREPFIGRFVMSPTRALAVLYGLRHDGGVDWYRQASPGAPGTPENWQGPVRTHEGFKDYLKIFPGGGNDLYALRRDGVLQWWTHDDFNTGGPGWTGPRDITFGWNDPLILSVTPGGNRVLYRLDDRHEFGNGGLTWLRHDGVTTGFDANAWSGPVVVHSEFAQFVRLFSVNEGVVYGVTADGRLMWHRHKGFRNGASVWDGPRQVGTGWQNFRDVFATDGGLIYGQHDDGSLMRYVHLGWETGAFTWIDPVPVAFGMGGYKQVISLMSRSPDPIN